MRLISFFFSPLVIPANIGMRAKGSIAKKISKKLFKNVVAKESVIQKFTYFKINFRRFELRK
jgi:hypothetical protein